MLDYEEVICSSNACVEALSDIGSARISHAYLFLSADENYLFKFAEKFTTLLINENDSENSEKNTLRIKDRTHPDVMYYGLGGEKIVVDTVSEIIDSAQKKPFESDKKIFVIFGAENLTEAVQNKILKTIEEPPANTYFLFLATNKSKLLPTVLSRVKEVELGEIPSETIASMLEKNGVKSDRAAVFASCAGGNASFAEKLALDDGFIDFFSRIVSCFFEINGSRDVLKYSTIFTSKNIDSQEFFDIAILLCRDILMIISGEENLVTCKIVLSKLKVISSSFNLSALTKLISLGMKSKRDLTLNANQTAVIDNFLFKLAEVKVKCRRL